MPSFRVVVRAELPPAPAGSEVQPVGFIVTRWVEAPTPLAASEAAMTLLRAESKYQRLVGQYGREPDLAIDEVRAGSYGGTGSPNRSGYIFFEDN
jgi:hypothetical protein